MFGLLALTVKYRNDENGYGRAGMSWFLYIFVGLSLLKLATNYRDEKRGITVVDSPGTGSPAPEVVDRRDNPEMFRHAMQYQWGGSIVQLVGAYVLWRIGKSQEPTDPMSHEFVGQESLEELDRKMSDELDKFHRPLRQRSHQPLLG